METRADKKTMREPARPGQGGKASPTSELKALQTRLADVLRPLTAITKLTSDQAAQAGKLEGLLRSLPDGSNFGAVVDEVKAEGLALAERTRRDRETQFRKIETD